jgi:opacity protein-like surface antigen
MNNFILTIITLSSTLLGFSLQANQSYDQSNECYVLEDNWDTTEAYCCNEERACTDKGFYVGGFAGIGFLDFNGNTGFTGGLAGGYKFKFNLRVEGEFAYRYHRIYGFNVSTYSYMANAVYDLPQIFEFTPYVGYGLGYGRSTVTVHSHGISVSSHADEFVMQGIFGLSRKVWNDVHLGLEYRIFGTENDVYDHSVVFSVKRFI